MAAKPTGVKTSQSDIIEAVAGVSNHTRATVEQVVVDFQHEITRQLNMGNNVALSIGTFMRADKAARTARNPASGEPVKVPAKNGARFKVGTKLKKALNP